MYQARILDRDRNLVAVLDTTGWNYTKRRNEATTVAAVDLPREAIEEYISTYGMLSEKQPSRNEGQDDRFDVDENKLQYANIAYYLQLYKDDELMTSAVITDRDVADNTISVDGMTEEILLERGQTPARYGRVFEGLDVADVARTLVDNWETKRIAAKPQWEENIDSEDIDLSTEPGRVILDREGYAEDGEIEGEEFNLRLYADRVESSNTFRLEHSNILPETVSVYDIIDGEKVELKDLDFQEEYGINAEVKFYNIDADAGEVMVFFSNFSDEFELPVYVDYQYTPGQYKEEGHITMRFDSEDFYDFKIWDRIRFVADNEDPNFTSMYYRYGDTETEVNNADWSREFDGGSPEELGFVPAATDERYIDIKLELKTDDTTSEDPAGREIGTTPVVYSLEVSARTESELEKGDIPDATGVYVEDAKADRENKLAVMVDVCEQTGYEFDVTEWELNLYEEVGEDRTDDFVLRNGTNMNITTLADDDENLANIVTANGAGSGLKAMQVTLKDEDSIEEYGTYPVTVDFEVEDYDELVSKAQDYLDTYKTPVQSFAVNALFEEEPEYGYGDIIKVADPRSGIVTKARIEEIKKNYDNGGLRVQLELDKPRRGLVDAVIDPRVADSFAVPRPHVNLKGKIQGIDIKANFADFEGYKHTTYHVSEEENFTPKPDNRVERGDEHKLEITGLEPNQKYYVKAVNIHETGRRSVPSVEKAVVTKGETVSSTLSVAAENTSNKGKAGADFVCENPVSQEKINSAIESLFSMEMQDFEDALYNEGEGEEDWEEGYTEGSYGLSKENDHLYITVYDGQATWVTSKQYNFDDVEELEVDWGFDTSSTAASAAVCISSSQQGDIDTFEERLIINDSFSRKTDTLDVSNINGNQYIRIHAEETDSQDTAELRTYQLTLSGEEEVEVGGGKVVLLESEYIVDDSINMKSNVTLEGQGEGTEIIASENISTAINMILSNNNQNIKIKNCKLNGNKENHFENSTGIRITNSNDALISDIKVSGCSQNGYYILGSGSRNIDLRNCKASDCNGDGIGVENEAKNININRCDFSSNEGNGVEIFTGSAHISNCTIENNGRRGIDILGETFMGEYDVVAQLAVSNNYIVGNQFQGIRLDGSIEESKINGNELQNNSQTGAGEYSQISLQTLTADFNMEDIKIENNSFLEGNEEEYCIHIDVGITEIKNTIIKGNDFKDGANIAAIKDDSNEAVVVGGNIGLNGTEITTPDG